MAFNMQAFINSFVNPQAGGYGTMGGAGFGGGGVSPLGQMAAQEQQVRAASQTSVEQPGSGNYVSKNISGVIDVNENPRESIVGSLVGATPGEMDTMLKYQNTQNLRTRGLGGRIGGLAQLGELAFDVAREKQLRGDFTDAVTASQGREAEAAAQKELQQFEDAKSVVSHLHPNASPEEIDSLARFQMGGGDASKFIQKDERTTTQKDIDAWLAMEDGPAKELMKASIAPSGWSIEQTPDGGFVMTQGGQGGSGSQKFVKVHEDVLVNGVLEQGHSYQPQEPGKRYTDQKINPSDVENWNTQRDSMMTTVQSAEEALSLMRDNPNVFSVTGNQAAVRISSIINDLKLKQKNYYDLGVLSADDMAMLDSIVGDDPTSIQTFLKDPKVAEKTAVKLQEMVKRQMNRLTGLEDKLGFDDQTRYNRPITEEEWRNLPPGTWYTAPDGERLRKK